VFEPLFPGDHRYEGVTWNELFDEPGESFAAYMYGYRRGTAVRKIDLWPMGPRDRRMNRALALLEEFLAVAFSAKVRVREGLEPPPGSYNSHHDQYDANAVLNGMIRDPRVDHVSSLNVAVTRGDLYAGRLAFVFGYADYVQHVGVLSIHRLGGSRDGSLFGRRLLKLARHEVGHMFGMAHCTAPSCVMRGANTRAEADSLPLHMCPSCAAKLAWRIGDDGRERSEALARFYSRHFERFLERKLEGPITRGD
jgi:archaemetzincin